MNKELFKQFNDAANYNLGIKGNLSNVVVNYAKLAAAMGKEEIANEKISQIPVEGLNNPDPRLSAIVEMYAPQTVELEARVR